MKSATERASISELGRKRCPTLNTDKRAHRIIIAEIQNDNTKPMLTMVAAMNEKDGQDVATMIQSLLVVARTNGRWYDKRQSGESKHNTAKPTTMAMMTTTRPTATTMRMLSVLKGFNRQEIRTPSPSPE